MRLGAIFDMDGLLLDTERLYQESWIFLAGAFGQTPAPEFPSAVSGSNGEGMLAIIRHYYPKVDAQAFMNACIRRVDGILDASGAPVKTGVREILTFFRDRGVKIAVASSSARARIEANLRQTELLPFFDAVASGQEVLRGKPEPDIFLLAAERIGVPPEDCFVFEDSPNGIRAASAAGCTPVMIPDMTPATPELEALSAAVCASLLEARDRIAAGTL